MEPCDEQNDRQTDGRRRATSYSALSIYAICCRVLKTVEPIESSYKYKKVIYNFDIRAL